ncbi:MAG: hypothetical protein PHE29_09900 [Tissierellia bacterium]|nr:hypothetical protein [Tissierellia bacterium]
MRNLVFIILSFLGMVMIIFRIARFKKSQTFTIEEYKSLFYRHNTMMLIIFLAIAVGCILDRCGVIDF